MFGQVNIEREIKQAASAPTFFPLLYSLRISACATVNAVHIPDA